MCMRVCVRKCGGRGDWGEGEGIGSEGHGAIIHLFNLE